MFWVSKVKRPPAETVEVWPPMFPTKVGLVSSGWSGAWGIASAVSTRFTSAAFGPAGSTSLKKIGYAGRSTVTPALNEVPAFTFWLLPRTSL